MERMIIKLSMFHTLALGVLSIWFGDWLRGKFPFLKKYCLPGAVVGGTIFAIISLLLYNVGICELQFDYKVANSLFYCIFFAASGAAARAMPCQMRLSKKAGKARCSKNKTSSSTMAMPAPRQPGTSSV